jgi:hypothetical protein
MDSYTDVRSLTDSELDEVRGGLITPCGYGGCPEGAFGQPLPQRTSPDLVGLLQFLLRPLL